MILYIAERLYAGQHGYYFRLKNIDSINKMATFVALIGFQNSQNMFVRTMQPQLNMQFIRILSKNEH
jgi:hypothetical protein